MPPHDGPYGANGEAIEILGTITLPGQKRSVGCGRGFLRDLIPDDHPSLDDLVAVGSEFVCNAVTHTKSGDGGKVTVTLALCGDCLRVLVADDGAGGGRPYLKTAEEGGEGGRGIRIVQELSLRWGFWEDGPCTTAWADFPRLRVGSMGDEGR